VRGSGSAVARGALHGTATLADTALFALIGLALWVVIPVVAAGLSPVVVTSASMSPLIRPGDVVLGAAPPAEPLAAGAVITFVGPSSDGTDRLITHRVVAASPEGYLTRGDANRVDDRGVVPYEDVRSVGRIVVPVLGYPAVWLRGGSWGSLALAMLAVTAIALHSTLLGPRTWRASRAATRPAPPDDASAEHVPTTEVPSSSEDLEAAGTTDALPAHLVAARRLPPADDLFAHLGARPAPADPLFAHLGTPEGAAEPTPDATLAPRGGPSSTVARLTRDPGLPAGRRAQAALRAGSLVLLLATIGTAVGLAPLTAASLEAQTGNQGNRFAVAAGADPELSTSVEVTTDWVTGYCAAVTVTTTSVASIAWTVTLDLDAYPLDGTPTEVWNATWTYAAPTLTASGTGATATVAADAPVGFGFCAERAPTPLELTIPAIDGATSVTSGNGNQSATFTVTSTQEQDAIVVGPARADVRVRNNQGGNASRDVVVTVAVDGEPIATGSRTGLGDLPDWTTVEVPLGWVEAAIPAGAEVTVSITIQRLQLEVAGPTTITLGEG
jgi:signal peptidase I